MKTRKREKVKGCWERSFFPFSPFFLFHFRRRRAGSIPASSREDLSQLLLLRRHAVRLQRRCLSRRERADRHFSLLRSRGANLLSRGIRHASSANVPGPCGPNPTVGTRA